MQFLVAALIGALGQAAASLVGRILLAMGIAYVTYSGIDIVFTWAQQKIITNMQGLGSTTVSFLAWMYVDKCISMIISAITASFILNGITSGSFTKMVHKP